MMAQQNLRYDVLNFWTNLAFIAYLSSRQIFLPTTYLETFFILRTWWKEITYYSSISYDIVYFNARYDTPGVHHLDIAVININIKCCYLLSKLLTTLTTNLHAKTVDILNRNNWICSVVCIVCSVQKYLNHFGLWNQF